MRIPMMILAMLLVAGLRAQADSATPMPEPGCLMATDERAWRALDLSTEQLQRVQRLRTACETDCAMRRERDDDPRALQGVMEKYLEEVREVLGEEQYKRWVQWCGQRPAKG
jgi:hypothetical protein